MIRRKNLYTSSTSERHYIPRYEMGTHVHGNNMVIEVTAGCFGLYPKDVIKIHGSKARIYSKDGIYTVLGVCNLSNTTVNAFTLCCYIVNPVNGYEDKFIFLFHNYILSNKNKLLRGIDILRRDYRNIPQYKQYTYLIT